MKRLKAFIVALFMTGVAIPAVATPSYEDKGLIQEHIELIDTLEDLGITVSINEKRYCGRAGNNVAGFWMGSEQLFVICQQAIRNSKFPVWTGEVVMASDDVLDTIRHEAHHVIQDCKDGSLNGELQPYMNATNLETFLSHYEDWKENHIAKQYAQSGASPHVIRLEIEAWAVADLITAPAIQEVLARECKL